MLQNFPLFSEKSTASLICTSVWLLTADLVTY